MNSPANSPAHSSADTAKAEAAALRETGAAPLRIGDPDRVGTFVPVAVLGSGAAPVSRSAAASAFVVSAEECAGEFAGEFTEGCAEECGDDGRRSDTDLPK